ncbi:dockerin type I domain-containing protein [Lacrimispora sp.]|uniref:dockerin type I domain-containing protein n=1 Tax=Lacrimispora sp. TaxID=2719234 RepID=UPI003FA5F639
MVGDLNGDTSVEATDYALMKMYLLGSIQDFPVQNDLAARDLNLDNVISKSTYSL